MPDGDELDSERTLATGQAAGGARERRPGEIVGGIYKIKSVIGRGGMGVVYCAEHLTFNREYALKALAPDRIDESNWLRFQAEGKAIAKLDHPNIVKVYDMGTDGHDCLYYVMDLLHGVSLAEVIHRRGIMEMTEAMDIFGQLCAGLGYAHKLGLIHRDIKPSNIILPTAVPGQKAPLVKIIDYGLVKLVDDGNQAQQSQTATGLVCGSPFYMSPEQCLGRKIDERSDIYSLGCTLFECLTGEPPFSGNNGLETAFKHQTEAIPKLSDFRPDKKYPENLEQVVNRMLQKTPAKRYQSMEQVGQDLLRVKQGNTVSPEAIHQDSALFVLENADAAESKKTHPIVWLAIGGTLAILLIVWASVSFRPHPAAVTESTVPGAPKLSDEAINVRELYSKWPQISSGVVEQDGARVRLFKFPEVPVGFICWGYQNSQRQLAKGEIQAPANEPITLQLPRPEGMYARLFPGILSKIGPEDIYSLEEREPSDILNDTLLLSEVSPDFVHSISKWTALSKLDFYHGSMKHDAVLALNELHPIGELKLRDASIDGADLAQVKWLNQVKILDIKAFVNVDPILARLAGSVALERLFIDATSPSKQALQGLTTCPHLVSLSASEAELDPGKLAVICEMRHLEELSISHCPVTSESVDAFSKLKNLKRLSVATMDPADLARLKTLLPPHCLVKSDTTAPGDYRRF